ncbi:MAG: HpcH/HpaI aldolase family protein [Bacillota bacterium]
MKKTVRSLLESGKKAIGVFIMYPFDTGVEVLKFAGVDFAIYDLEHEQLTISELLPMIRTSDACGMAAMVRVPDVNDESSIKKALDIGASGIMVPGVSNAEQARKAVSYSKYAPQGERGFCPFVRSNEYGFFADADYYRRKNDEVVVTIIIESIEGVKNMEEIVAVDGIDVVTMGAYDLSCALGIPGQVTHPSVMQTMQDCITLCGKYGKYFLGGAFKPEDIEIYRNYENVVLIITVSPIHILYNSYKSLCDGLRSV